jgi:hypothetical protein
MNDSTALPLAGLSGDNPLGFLAAVGTFRTLSLAWPDRQVRMSWHPAGCWQPLIHINGTCTPDEVVATLQSRLVGRHEAPEFTELGDDLPVAVRLFTECASRAARLASRHERTYADYCAAFGCEAYAEKELIQDTELRTMSGAGHQHFLAFMREIAEGTTPEHLRAALFATWTYSDPRPSMRWDPQDDRRYALRASDPANGTQSPIQTVRGANRLAIEALPCFPTMPVGSEVRTRGFFRNDSGMIFSWPIWIVDLSFDGLQSLLGHCQIIAEKPRQDILRPLGVVEVFHSRRLTVGRFRNFAPGLPCWGFLVDSSVLR